MGVDEEGSLVWWRSVTSVCLAQRAEAREMPGIMKESDGIFDQKPWNVCAVA